MFHSTPPPTRVCEGARVLFREAGSRARQGCVKGARWCKVQKQVVVAGGREGR